MTLLVLGFFGDNLEILLRLEAFIPELSEERFVDIPFKEFAVGFCHIRCH